MVLWNCVDWLMLMQHTMNTHRKAYRAAVLNLLTSADPHWITTGSRGPISHFYDLNLKTTHKQYITNKYTNYEIFYLIKNEKIYKNRNFNFNGKFNQLNFNLQFQIPSFLQSVLKFSISDFAFLRKHTLLICWEKLFDFLNSRGPPE
jgi:hypothetical protein